MAVLFLRVPFYFFLEKMLQQIKENLLKHILPEHLRFSTTEE
jgi:hypothetical protein